MDDPLRRRSIGAPAARSVLLTILGEYVLPRGAAVWQETLVAALSEVGYGVHAARQALGRSAKEGWLVAERHGRRARLRLSPDTAALLESGAERIYRFGSDGDWDGQWLIVVVRVPESDRHVRHQLRTRLAWAGLGSLGSGVWVTPRVEREGEVLEIVRAESAAEAITFRGGLASAGDPRQLARAAWDLDEVRGAYDEFVAAFSRSRPSSPEACFERQTAMVHAWRKFPFLDPDLPPELLPPKWPRRRAYELFHDRHLRWEAHAREHFEALEARIGLPLAAS